MNRATRTVEHWPSRISETPTEKANASSSTTFRENVYLVLAAIYIRFSNAVKKKFGCNSTFTLHGSLNVPENGCFQSA